MATVADVVLATLKESGVRRIYGLPGDSLNGLTDAIRRDGEISWRLVRHEEAAAFAAAGESRRHRRTGVRLPDTGMSPPSHRSPDQAASTAAEPRSSSRLL